MTLAFVWTSHSLVANSNECVGEVGLEPTKTGVVGFIHSPRFELGIYMFEILDYFLAALLLKKFY